mgnify:CR=1 FL=1
MEQHSISAPAGTRFASWSRRLRREFIWAYQGNPFVPKNTSILRNVAVWRMLEGSVEVTAQGSTTTVHAGQWFSPGTHFSQAFSEDAVILSLHFSCEWMTGKSLFPPNLQIQIPAQDHPELDPLAQRLIEAIPAIPHSNLRHLEKLPISLSTFLKIDSLFADWLSAWIDALEQQSIALTETPGIRTEVLRAIDYIRRLPHDKPFNEIDVVHVSGLSRSALIAQYTDIVGLSPRQHHDKLKMEATQTALEIGDSQLKMLAFELGFQSASQFSNWFRRRQGISPREYREQHQKLSRI